MRFFHLTGLALVALVAILDCAGSDDGSSSGAGGSTTCMPGQQIACACLGGGEGVQLCDDNGARYGACEGCTASDSATSVTTSTTSATTTTAETTTTAATTGTGGATTGAGGATSSTTDAASSSTGGPTPCPPGPIDLSQVTLYSNPPDLASWPVTTSLTEVDFTNDGVHVSFSKEDGDGRWPDVVPPGWDGPLEYTLGMVECIDGQWYGSAVIEFWNGLYAEGGNVADSNQIAMNWYYDAIRWGTLAGRQPQPGEMVGVFVAAGNLRNVDSDDPAQSPLQERSNVVLVPFPDVNGANNSF